MTLTVYLLMAAGPVPPAHLRAAGLWRRVWIRTAPSTAWPGRYWTTWLVSTPAP